MECSSGKTGSIEARVRDLIDGNVKVVSVPESATFSIPAVLSQPSNTDGSMKGLVMISVTQSLSAASGKVYVVEFLCHDAFGAFEVGEPKVKLLKDL